MFARVLVGILLSLSAGIAASGQVWQRLGPSSGMVVSLGTGAGGAAYLGTADGHIFVRENARQPWELRGRIGRRIDAVVSHVLADPAKVGVAFASVWYQQPGAGGGVFRTEDAGRTWKLLGLQEEAVRALELANSQARIIFAGTRTGVFRSADEGKTWERISPKDDPEIRNVDSLAVDPRDSNVIYAGTYHLPWKTTDGGKSWNPVVAGLIDDSDIMSLRIDATNPERLFLSACSGIYRSENQGGQWTKLQGIPYAARRTHSIVQDLDTPQILYAGTTEGLWVTRDGGESWKRTTPKDWVINSVTVLSSREVGTAGVLIGTESRGVLISQDAGKTFIEYNDGFTHQVIRQLIPDSRDATHLLMMMERSGTVLRESHDGGRNWTPLPLAKDENKPDTLLRPETVDRLYASPWGWLVRMFNGQLWILDAQKDKWREWKLRLLPVDAVSAARSSKQSGRTKAGDPLPLTPLPSGTLGFSQESAYVPTREGLLRCDLTVHCVRLKAFGRGGQIGALHVSVEGSVLTVAMDNKLAISRDGGQTAQWADLPVSSRAVLWLDSLEVEGKGNLLLATLDGLFTSADDGATWKLSERGLPAGQVEILLQGHGFLAASLREGGLYLSHDHGATWSRADRDSERSRFTGLVETAPGILTIGSQSEGVLRFQDLPIE